MLTDHCSVGQSHSAKANLQDHARILQESCIQDLHAICPFSCTILHQFLQDLAKNVQEMQVIILAATLAKSCTISCKICARLCKNRARKGTYRVQVFMQDSCKILAQSCMILQVRFCWACSNCLQPHSVVEVYTEVERHHQQFCRTVIQCDKEVECPIVDGHLPSPVHYSYPLLRYGDLIL